MKLRLLVAMAIAIGGAFPAGAAPSQATGEFALATLDRGIHVGFVLLRPGASASSGEVGETFIPGARSVNRILYDRQTSAFFGYRIEVEPAPKNRFEVTFSALPKGAEKNLHLCPTCPAPTRLAGALQRFPAPRTVADGEMLQLELLQNPATGEKIVDVVQVASWPLTAESMTAASSKVLDGIRVVTKADGDFARGDCDAAVGGYVKAIALHPEDPVLHNKLGICYQRTGKNDKAQAEYEEAVRLNPAFATAWNNLATVHHTLGRYPKAISAYRKAIEKRPDFAAAWRNLGAAELARGNVEQGLAAYREAVRLDPSTLENVGSTGVAVGGLSLSDQYFYFAKLMASNGQVAASIEYLEKAHGAGFSDFSRIHRDVDFSAVVKDPRFKEFQKRIRR